MFIDELSSEKIKVRPQQVFYGKKGFLKKLKNLLRSLVFCWVSNSNVLQWNVKLKYILLLYSSELFYILVYIIYYFLKNKIKTEILFGLSLKVFSRTKNKIAEQAVRES